jgi:hypothetical protein
VTRHVVALSGGKDSTCLALRLREVEPREYDYLLTPVGNELDEMAAHWARLGRLLGRPLTRLKPFTDGDGLLYLIRRMGALPNWRQRWCTRMLKIEPAIAWLREHAPCVQYVGLRADEDASERAGIYGEVPGVTQRYPLREWGWGEADVWQYLAAKGVLIPRRTDCAWCYGQRIVEWYRLWQERPGLFEQAAALERETGYTFRSPARDTWPASLDGLRREFEAGRAVRGAPKPGCLQLDLWEAGEPEHRPCRVCSL